MKLEEHRIILGFDGVPPRPLPTTAVLEILQEQAPAFGPVVGWWGDRGHLDVVLALDALDPHAAVAAIVPVARAALRGAGIAARLVRVEAELVPATRV